ncbi:MAG: DUF721 domain-containing protein [Acidobacteriota bacterium]
MIRANRLIPAVLAEIIRKAPLSPEKVAFAWNTVVGPGVAKATRVVLADQGVLVVTTADAHWAREVRRASGIIQPKLDDLLGAGTVKSLRVAPAQPSGDRRGSARPPTRPGTDNRGK